MKKTLVASLAVTLFFVAGCGGASAGSAAGTYELDKAAMKEAMLAAVPAEQKANKEAMAMIESMASSMEGTVELKADGTATMRMKMEMMGKTMDDSETGTWKLDGNKLSITTKDKASGKDETHTVDYANGSFAIEQAEGPTKMKLTFRRK